MNAHIVIWIIQKCPYTALSYDKQACNHCEAAYRCKTGKF